MNQLVPKDELLRKQLQQDLPVQHQRLLDGPGRGTCRDKTSIETRGQVLSFSPTAAGTRSRGIQ